MSATESPSQLSDQQVGQLLELTERILMVRSFGDLAECALPSIADVTQSGSVFIYISDSRLSASRFLQHGFQPETTSAIEKLCAEQFDSASDQVDFSTSASEMEKAAAIPDLRLYPLRDEETYVGLLGLTPQKDADVLDWTLAIFPIPLHVV